MQVQYRTRLNNLSCSCSLFWCLPYRERLEQALKLANSSAEKERQKLQEERDSLKKQVRPGLAKMPDSNSCISAIALIEVSLQVDSLEHALAGNKRCVHAMLTLTVKLDKQLEA